MSPLPLQSSFASRQNSSITISKESLDLKHPTSERILIPSDREPTPGSILDGPGSEASEYAHVWHVYNTEATKLDNASIEGFHRGIDVLLVFTGLFSAVLTTFIIQTYQQMTPQASDTTNRLLEKLISLQTNGSQGAEAANASGIPSSADLHWVNGLWFAALSCSLSAALISMLGKQWIQQAPSGGTSGSARYRARRRQRRHQQMLSWHVFTVINALPVLLHVALLLFFAGLIVLLWSGNTAIMAVTFAIVALAYSFYVGSIWVSLMYPDCPYQHPLSATLRQWMSERHQRNRSVTEDLEGRVEKEPRTRRKKIPQLPVDADEELDACALIWLLDLCRSDDVVTIALQAIGGLPRNFSAFHLLRDAGATPMVLQRFTCCFHRDSTNLQWHIIDPVAAEKYCRAWMRLTHNTDECWPHHLDTPLGLLRTSENIQISTTACCAVALQAVDSRPPQLTLVTLLQEYVKGEVDVGHLSQCWLLETFLECSLNWEFPAANRDDIVKRAIPPLLKLLKQASGSPRSPTRSLIVLVLHSLTGGKVDPSLLLMRDKRESCYHLAFIPSLAAIIDEPSRFGVEGELLDFIALEFTRVTAPIINHSANFPLEIKKEARQALSSLYSHGIIGPGVAEADLAEILQILHPLDDVPLVLQPSYAKRLLDTLVASNDANVAVYATRLLESLLLEGHLSVIEAVVEHDGVCILVRAANTGNIDSRRLQIDCIRTLCILIESMVKFLKSASMVSQQSNCRSLKDSCDIIFQSEADFFSTLVSAVNSRRWWLPEIAEVWLPSLMQLCEVRPNEHVWVPVESAFRKFAELHDAENGAQKMLKDLERMKHMIPEAGLAGGRGSLDSRKVCGTPLSPPPSRKPTSDKT